MRYPMPPAVFAALPDTELVERREFLSTTTARGFIPFGYTTMRERIKKQTFPKAVVATDGGPASLWTVKQIKEWKAAYEAALMKGAAA